MIWVELHENEASRAKHRSRYVVMPKNCCVPECKKMVYVENWVNVSFHTFPEERKLFLSFQVTTHTRVCSRQFKPSDYLSSLAGVKGL